MNFKIGDRVFVHGYIDEIRKDIVIIRNNGGYFGTVPSEVVTGDLPSAQQEPDWDYSEETKQITLIVPEDVYNSAETIFLSVGYEGTFGIRGMVYSVQSSSSCVHENDSISRQAAIDAANRADYTGLTVEDVKKVTDEVVKELKKLPSAQPEPAIPLQWIEARIEWLKSLDNTFSTLTAVQISAMVNKWKEEQDETD